MPASGVNRFAFARRFFLQGLGLIYLVAFLSLGVQIVGLAGEHGILPAARWLDTLAARMSLTERIANVPTLLWIDVSDGILRGSCLFGAVLSGLLVLGVATIPLVVVLWILYLSLLPAGSIFLGYQWDALLLEVGFLAIFLTPGPIWRFSRQMALAAPPNRLAVLLAQVVLFKLMFCSGVVKLSSGDPTWRDLSAMSFHFWTQPIPNPMAWHIAQLPDTMLRAITLATFFVELVVPFAFFGPRVVRHAGGLITVLLQIGILATGNYGFFNWLTLALALFLFDDAWWQAWILRVRRGGTVIGAEPSARERRRNAVAFALAPIFVGLALLSLVHISSSFRRPVPWPEGLRTLVRVAHPLHLSNGYGLFAIMTTERPEIIIEGSEDGRTWTPYVFRYKAGALDERPPWILGHMPRLDWQMWFAALGGERQATWLRSFLQRLLEGEPTVLGLLEGDPFSGRPPRYVRAELYSYRFTNRRERAASGHWWSRTQKTALIGPLSLTSPKSGASSP